METTTNPRVSKREFISRVATRSELPVRVVNKVYESLLGELTGAVSCGETVVLTSFGRFYRQDHKGHKVRFFIEHKGELVETVLGERDMVSVPPGLYRGLRNEGIEEALMCVLIGNPKPVTPTYPPEHPVSQIKRDKK